MVKIGKYLSSEFKVNTYQKQGYEIVRLLIDVMLGTSFKRSKV